MTDTMTIWLPIPPRYCYFCHALMVRSEQPFHDRTLIREVCGNDACPGGNVSRSSRSIVTRWHDGHEERHPENMTYSYALDQRPTPFRRASNW